MKIILAIIAFAFAQFSHAQFQTFYNPANVRISGGTINGTTYGETTPANATVSRLRIGASNDLYLTRYAAKQVMISGDGVGATTNAGFIVGNYSDGYGALWRSNAVPIATNYVLKASSADAVINNETIVTLAVGNSGKFTTGAALNTSINPLSITDTTDSSSTITGSLKTAGGLGVAKKLWVGDEVTVIKAASSALNIRNSAETVGLATYLTFGSSTYNRAQLRSTASGTQGGDLSVFTAPSGANPIERVNISADGVTTFYGSVSLTKTITAPGTTGAQTINKSTGRVNFAAAATSLVVTNSLATANSICHVTKATNDATMRLGACVAAAGNITIYADVAPAAETAVNFTITN